MTGDQQTAVADDDLAARDLRLVQDEGLKLKAPLRLQVGAEVRAWMARRDVTGEALAALMGKSGAYVSRRLRGRTALDLDDLESISRILRVPVEVLTNPPAETRALLTLEDHSGAYGVTVGKGTTKGSCSTVAGNDAVRHLADIPLVNGCNHSSEWLSVA